MSDEYTLEGFETQFIYLCENGKKIATIYGNAEQKLERGYMIIDALSRSEVGEVDVPEGAIKALEQHQRQIDADGAEVGVSRQALDEVIVYLRQSQLPVVGVDIDHDCKLALTYINGVAIHSEDEMLAEAAEKIEGYLRQPDHGNCPECTDAGCEKCYPEGDA